MHALGGTVPLGGVGAGCAEFGADSRVKTLSIFNNRAPETVVRASPDSFLAVRYEQEGEARCIALQREADSEEQSRTPLHRVHKDAFQCHGIFPMLHFSARSDKLPVSIVWTYFSPLIPFDHEASVMPAVLAGVRVRNRSSRPMRVSALLHWENYPCPASGVAPSGATRFAAVDEEDPLASVRDEHSGEPPNALLFERGEIAPQGELCIAARATQHTDVSVGAYAAGDAHEASTFWRHFADMGSVPSGRAGGSGAEFGAVCSSFLLGPKEERSIDFVLAWHFPGFAADGQQAGHGYAALLPSAEAVARRALRHAAYYHQSVADWQNRLTASTLPKWLVKELINSARVFVRQGLYSGDGRFALQRDWDEPAAGEVADRLYTSLSTLLFFPRFEEEELGKLLRSRDTAQPGALCARLGRLDAHAPEYGGDSPLLLAANLAISAYRNHRMTGSLVRIQKLFPFLRDMMRNEMQDDEDGDGIPDTPGLTAHAAGLWLLALGCYARMADERDEKIEAERFRETFRRAQAAFERLFWDAKAGCYREQAVEATEAMPHSARYGALAGQWQSDALGLGPMLQPARIAASVDALYKRILLDLEQAPEALFTHPDTAHYAIAHAGCLLIQRDRAREGLDVIHKLLQASEAGGAQRAQRSSALSIWHVLHAITGVHLDMAAGQLRVTPHLPPQVDSLGSPVFTPACLAWLKYKVDTAPQYRQRVHLAFDSPTNLKSVLLRIPADIEAVEVSCEVPEGPVGCQVILRPGEYFREAVITLDRPQFAGGGFSLDLRAAGRAPQKPRGWLRAPGA